MEVRPHPRVRARPVRSAPAYTEVAGPRQQAAKLLALGLGGGILWTLSLTSHGAATPEIRSFALASDFIHLLAVAFWVGGLFHFALGAPVVMSALSPRADRGMYSIWNLCS